MKKLLKKLLGKSDNAHQGQTTSSQLGTLYQDGFFETEKTVWINEHIFKYLVDSASSVEAHETKIPNSIQTEIQAFLNQGSQHMPVPRQPMLLPKLIHAINNPKVGVSGIVSLITSEPKLASEVINQANSAYYRVSSNKISSIKRAIDILGNNGLRRVATNIAMSPILQVDNKVFPEFTDKLWKQSLKCAIAAEELAKQKSTGAEKGYLLGLLSSLGAITLYQLVMKYHKASKTTPEQTAKILFKTLNVYRWKVNLKIFESWNLPENMIEAILDHERQIHPNKMSTYGNILYHANLCASVHTLLAEKVILPEKGRLILLVQGLLKSQMAAVFDQLATNEK